MKSLSIVFLIALLTGITQSVLAIDNCRKTAIGTADNWINYTGSANGIYIDVDLSEYGFKETPQVMTSLTCKTQCWTVTGVNSIYKLTNKGFRVYVYNVIGAWSPAQAKEKNWVLHYTARSMDDE